MDDDSYIHSLLVSNPLREKILSEMIRSLKLPKGSKGLDAGCGIGLQCLLLAQEVGPAGHVTGLDLSSNMIRYGTELIKNSLSEQISFQVGDILKLPFENDSFDWAWSV